MTLWSKGRVDAILSVAFWLLLLVMSVSVLTFLAYMWASTIVDALINAWGLK